MENDNLVIIGRVTGALIVGALMVIASGPIRRATWAVYGVVGYYAALLHYMITGLNESRWTFAVALFAAGLSIFVLGLLLHRAGGLAERNQADPGS